MSGSRVSPGDRDYVSVPGARRRSIDLGRRDNAGEGEERPPQKRPQRAGRYDGNYGVYDVESANDYNDYNDYAGDE